MGDKKCAQESVRTFIIMDLETTSLPFDKPVRITEIGMVAAMREHILGFGNGITTDVFLPRVLSKLNICVYPRRIISQASTDLTLLSNELLEHQNPFDEHLFNILDSFVKRMPQPVCIVAHNGCRFDFPILQSEIQRIGKAFPDHVLCADSLPAFKEIFSNKIIKDMNNIPNTPERNVLKDIHTLSNNKSLQDNEGVLNPVLNNQTLGFVINELHIDDEALCLALETVEKATVSETDLQNVIFDEVDDMLCCSAVNDVETPKMKDECTVSESSSLNQTYERVNGYDRETEVSVIKEMNERTPDHSTTKQERRHNIAVNDSNAQTQKMETPSSNPVKRSTIPGSCRARKRLNFSPEKKLRNARQSFKLVDIYKFLLKRDAQNSHRAENDALTLLECIVASGENFTKWVDRNAIPFNSVKKMA